MSFINVSIIFLVLGLSGCSSDPNYNSATGCGSMTPVCLGLVAAVDIATNDSGASKKCSDLTGEQRKQCIAQVESLKKHIRDASKK